jgi:probable HAF family extracellular repeat protein
MRRLSVYQVGLVIGVFALLNLFTESHVTAQNIKYTVTEIGTFGGGRSVALSINNSGQVVGHAEIATNEFHAFLYEDDTLIDLGTLGGNESYGYSISDSCMIVGRSQNSSGLFRPFITSCAVDSPLLDIGSLDPLLDGSFSTVASVNKAGKAVGYTVSVAADHRGGRSRSFIFSGNRIVDLGTLGGEESIPTAINDADQIVGYLSREPHAFYAEHRGFLYRNGQVIDLGSLGGRTMTPVAINSSGKVVGYAETSRGLTRAFIYTAGVLQDLGTLPGGSQSLAFGINNSGNVVGGADNQAGTLHAFLYSNGIMQDLNDLIPPLSGWILSEARCINESGQIVGKGILKGQERGFLLTPIGGL